MMRFGEKMELYNEYELISHSKLADCSMFIVDMVYRPMHLHKEMELCYILSGTCRVSTDRQSFTAGAGGVLLFDAGAGHEIWAVGAPARILTLQLSHGFCSRFYPQIRNVRFGCRLLSDCLSADALLTLQHSVGKITLVEDELLAAKVSDDGKDVSVTDALLILQNSVNKIEFTNEQISAADLDKDGNVTVTDALLALQISVGKI